MVLLEASGLEAYHARKDGQSLSSGLHFGHLIPSIISSSLLDDEASEETSVESIRRAYGIGWKSEEVSCARARVARRMGVFDLIGEASSASCCVSVDEHGLARASAVAPEATAAVNPEYLSVCLQVRRETGREVFFSLEPVQSPAMEARHRMQRKYFEPTWLVDTSVGELLFQADFHLKELSMGQHQQPVTGMQSCLEMLSGGTDIGWHGREWFLVRHAEVCIAEGGALVPRVHLGVEAREQVQEAGGHLADCPITQPTHPLVRYAAAFSHYFDLIAERRSVFFHLRELAKASVLAKYLLEVGARVQEPWFAKPSPIPSPSPALVPQLWNFCAPEDEHACIHGVYGGVQFRLAAFDLTATMSATPPDVQGVPRSSIAWGLQGPLIGPGINQRPPLLDALVRAAPSEAFRVGIASEVPSLPRAVEYALRVGEPLLLKDAMGIDMGLEHINVSAAGKSGVPQVGKEMLAPLLARVFQPGQSDRFQDGADPILCADAAYVAHLHGLLADESAVR